MQTRSLLARAVILQMAGVVGNLEGAVRQAFASTDPDLSVVPMMTMNEQVAGNFSLNRRHG